MTAKTVTKTTDLVLVAAESVAAKLNASVAACSEMAALGFTLGKVETEIQGIAARIAALHAGNRGHAKTWFEYGYVAAYLLARAYPDAVEASEKDGAGNFGDNLLALGQMVCDRGASHGTKKIPAGKYERSEMEEAAWHAAYTKWKDLEFKALPLEKQAEIKAAKKRATGGKTKPKKQTVRTVKIASIPKPKGVKEAANGACLIGNAAGAYAKKAANDLPLSVKEAFAAAEIAAKAFLESVEDGE